MEATAGQIAVNEPPGATQDGEFGIRDERIEEQHSTQSNNNNNNNNHDENNNDRAREEHGYDKIKSKHPDSSRILFINMNSLTHNFHTSNYPCNTSPIIFFFNIRPNRIINIFQIILFS